MPSRWTGGVSHLPPGVMRKIGRLCTETGMTQTELVGAAVDAYRRERETPRLRRKLALALVRKYHEGH